MKYMKMKIKGYQMEVEIVRQGRADKFANPINSFNNRIGKIVEDGDPKPIVKQLDDGVGSDESSSAGDQNRVLQRPHCQDLAAEMRERDRCSRWASEI